MNMGWWNASIAFLSGYFDSVSLTNLISSNVRYPEPMLSRPITRKSSITVYQYSLEFTYLP